LAERRSRRVSALETGMQCSDRYGGARPLTLVNSHCKLEEDPVRHVEPVQLVVQYLTQAAIKLPSASDNVRSRVQHPL